MRAGEDRLADIERLQQQGEMYTKRIEMERRRADETEMKLNVRGMLTYCIPIACVL